MMMSETVSMTEYFIFAIGAQSWAIEAQCVREVLPLQNPSAIPLSASWIDGLVSISGAIMPQVNLADFLFNEKKLSHSATDQSSGSLIAVSVGDQSLALKVDQLFDSASIARHAIFSEQDQQQFCLETRNIFIFDVSWLHDIVHAKEKKAGEQSFLGEITAKLHTPSMQQEYLLFRCAEKNYACLLNEVHELVDVEHIHQQPGSHRAVVGVALVRNIPTLVLNLQQLIQPSKDHKTTVFSGAGSFPLLLIRFAHCYCALLLDSVTGLIVVDEDHVVQGDADWHRAILSSDKQVLAQAINFSSFFNDDVVAQFQKNMPSVQHASSAQKVEQAELLTFSFHQDVYALYVHDVIRIVSDKLVQPLLEQHAHIIGVLDFEGAAIPVIHLSAQLGYAGAQDTSQAQQEYIIVQSQQQLWALSIQRIHQILEVDEPTIEHLERSSDADHDLSVQAYAHYEGQLLSILEVDTLCYVNAMAVQGVEYA